jgi:raffinose/stachyose/melibiose transport system permease protein
VNQGVSTTVDVGSRRTLRLPAFAGRLRLRRPGGRGGVGDGPANDIRADRRVGFVLILPAVALLAVFIVYPLIRAVGYSFLNWDGVGSATSAGFANYTALWRDPVERASLINAGILIVFFAFIPTGLGLIAASLIARIPRRGMGILRAIYFLPQVLVTVVVAIVWTWILAPSGAGTLNAMLNGLGLGAKVGTPWLGNFNTALVSLGLVAVWLDFGLCFVLFLSGVQRISPSLYDAARVDGAGLFREMRFITIPMLRREIGIALTITIVASLQNFTLVYTSTNGGPGNSTVVPGLLVYRDAFQLGLVGAASALGVAMTVLVFVFVLVIRALLERPRSPR